MGELIAFDDAKRALIKKTVAKDLDQMEFDLFMAVASARGLDPVLRQIYAVKRKDGDDKKMVLQIGIDGFRLIAHRTGDYAGRDKAIFAYADDKPVECELTVYRLVQGMKVAFTATVRWSEYYPGDKLGFMWRKMPETMLEKTCEAKALRMAFPGDLSGLYLDEETQNEMAPEPREVIEAPPFDDEPRIKAIKATIASFAKLGVTEIEIKNKLKVDDLMTISDADVADLRQLGKDIVNKRKTLAEAFSKEKEFE